MNVDETWNRGVLPQIDHFGGGRNLRGIRRKVRDAIAADDDDRVGPHLAFSVNELAEAQRLGRRIGCRTAGSKERSQDGK
jgi:hypothetical protein